MYIVVDYIGGTGFARKERKKEKKRSITLEQFVPTTWGVSDIANETQSQIERKKDAILFSLHLYLLRCCCFCVISHFIVTIFLYVSFFTP